jgi:hypothetical protein
VDAHGVVTVRFDLPRAIAVGDGSLSVAIDDGAAVETTTRTIPILLTVKATLYPEGGARAARRSPCAGRLMAAQGTSCPACRRACTWRRSRTTATRPT